MRMRGIRSGHPAGQRQIQDEAAAPAAIAVHGHPAPVRFHDMLDESEPDAAAAPALRVAGPDPVELFEDPRVLGGGDADAVVGHLEPDLVARAAGADLDAPALA